MQIFNKSKSYLVCLFVLTAHLSSFAQKEAKVLPEISKTNIAIYNYDATVFDMEISSFYNIDDKVRNDLYKIIIDSLLKVNGVKIKPRNFLAGKIQYDMYGNPASRGKKAVATNKADSYISIGIVVSGTGKHKPPANEKNPDDCILSRQVALRLNITVFDKSGEMIFDDYSFAQTEKFVDFHYAKVMLGNIVGTKPEKSDINVVYDLMKMATDAMCKQKFPK